MTVSVLTTTHSVICVTLLTPRLFVEVSQTVITWLSFFKANQIIGKKLVKGENSDLPSYNSPISTHAEINALNRLLEYKGKKISRVKYDLLVIRLSKGGKMASSRPCYHCICTMEKSNVKIRYVYYSTIEGTIEREKFNKMKLSPLTYISSGRKHRTCKP